MTTNKTTEMTKKLHGKGFYKKIGRKGGKISKGGGFTNNSELASRAARIRWIKTKEDESENNKRDI